MSLGSVGGGLVLGTETFARSLKPGLRVKEREQRQARNLARPVDWVEIILAFERARGEQWAAFWNHFVHLMERGWIVDMPE